MVTSAAPTSLAILSMLSLSRRSARPAAHSSGLLGCSSRCIAKSSVPGVGAHLPGPSVGELASRIDPVCLIVVTFGHSRLMAKQPAHSPHPCGILERPKGRGPVPEQVQVYGLAKGRPGPPADGIVDGIAGERNALGGGPQSVMPRTPKQDRPKPLEIVLQGRPKPRGQRVPERPPVLGLAGLEHHDPAPADTLQVLPQGEAREVAAAHRCYRQECDDQPVPVGESGLFGNAPVLKGASPSCMSWNP